MGTFAAVLEAREISTEENLVADVEGDVEEVDGTIRVTTIRMRYRGTVPAGSQEIIEKALGRYADRCPAYVSVKGCIEVSSTADFEEIETS